MINYTGLHKRPTLDGIVDYLANGQESVKYPDRFAKQLRNHPYLTQFDAEGIFEVEELDRKMREQEQKNQVIQNIVNQSGMTSQAIQTIQRPRARYLSSSQTRGRSPPQTRGRSPPQTRDRSLPQSRTKVLTPDEVIDSLFDDKVSDIEELIRLQNEEFDRLTAQEKHEKTRAMSEAVKESLQPSYVGLLTEKSLESQPPQGIPEDIRRARALSRDREGTRMVALSPAHRGKTVRSSSSESRKVTTLDDLQERHIPASSSSVRPSSRGPSRERVGGRSAPSVGTQLYSMSFDSEYDIKGTRIPDLYKYWNSKIGSKAAIEKHFKERGLPIDLNKTLRELLVTLINYDRSISKMPGRAVIASVGNKSPIHIVYEKKP